MTLVILLFLTYLAKKYMDAHPEKNWSKILRDFKMQFFLGFKALLALLCAWGLVASISSPSQIHWHAFNYFTILIILIALIYVVLSFILNFLKYKKGERTSYTLLPRYKGMLLILMTMIIFIYYFIPKANHFSLIPDKDLLAFPNILTHYIIPALLIFDWVVFDKKGVFKKTDPLFWLILPIAYIVFIFTRAQFHGSNTNRYLYEFFDVDAIGQQQAFIHVIIIILACVLIGYIYYIADILLKRLNEKGKQIIGKTFATTPQTTES